MNIRTIHKFEAATDTDTAYNVDKAINCLLWECREQLCHAYTDKAASANRLARYRTLKGAVIAVANLYGVGSNVDVYFTEMEDAFVAESTKVKTDGTVPPFNPPHYRTANHLVPGMKVFLRKLK